MSVGDEKQKRLGLREKQMKIFAKLAEEDSCIR